jgi:transposase
MEDVISLYEQIAQLTKSFEQLQIENKLLRTHNVQLIEEINRLKHRKNSKNSSVSPSKDENRPEPNQSLREKSDKKVGGQPGHKGHTLQMSSMPDVVEVLKPDFCSKCGNDLSTYDAVFEQKRQVIDIPPIKAYITEYQLFSRKCTCGHCTKSTAPLGVDAPVQYGAGVDAIVAYLSTRQYISMERIKEFMSQMMGIDMSVGTVQNILVRVANKAMPFYDKIKEQIATSEFIGGDETSVKVNGKKAWIWTFQNRYFTFLNCTDNRGFKTLKSLFPDGLPNSVLGHDAYAAWFKFNGKAHQLCHAHLQRELNYFVEYYPKDNWAQKLKTLLYESVQAQSTKKHDAKYFKSKLDILLDEADVEKYSLLRKFVKRLKKYRDAVFTFLDYENVPPDNNGSERAIRNAKVKTKISGQFKSIENANTFAIIRTFIDTLVKQNQPVLTNLNHLAYI